MRIRVWIPWYIRCFLSLLCSLGNIRFVWWTLTGILARALHLQNLLARSKRGINAVFRKPGFVLVRDRGLHFLVSPTFRDIYVAKLLYERPVSNVVLRFKPSTFVNVGAHIGTYAVRFAVRGAKVLAIEPDHRSYSLLKANAKVNGVSGNVEALNVAAFSRRGKLSFYLRRFPIWSSVYGSGEYVAETNVDAYPLDTIAAELGNVDLMVIDVEGSEIEVLTGSNRVLGRTKRLVLEVKKKTSKDAIGILRRSGFELLEIHYGDDFEYYLGVRNGEQILFQ
jgi:FkbM family methyltransferase